MTDVADSGIRLTIRYLCEARRRGSAEKIWESPLERFAEAEDLDFAYPTVRYFQNLEEGNSSRRSQTDSGPSEPGRLIR